MRKTVLLVLTMSLAGWYSVYDADASTLAVIKAHAAEIAGLMK